MHTFAHIVNNNTFTSLFPTTKYAIIIANVSALHGSGCMQEPWHVATVRGRLSYIPSSEKVI